MSEIKVSFFSTLSVNSLTRRVPFPRTQERRLNMLIQDAMNSCEFFACYHSDDGRVVALDRDGVAVHL